MSQLKPLTEIANEILEAQRLMRTVRVKANHDKAFEIWCALLEENADRLAKGYLKLEQENARLRLSVTFLRGLRLGYEQKLGIDSKPWLEAVEKEELAGRQDEPTETT